MGGREWSGTYSLHSTSSPKTADHADSRRYGGCCRATLSTITAAAMILKEIVPRPCQSSRGVEIERSKERDRRRPISGPVAVVGSFFGQLTKGNAETRRDWRGRTGGEDQQPKIIGSCTDSLSCSSTPISSTSHPATTGESARALSSYACLPSAPARDKQRRCFFLSRGVGRVCDTRPSTPPTANCLPSDQRSIRPISSFPSPIASVASHGCLIARAVPRYPVHTSPSNTPALTPPFSHP